MSRNWFAAHLEQHGAQRLSIGLPSLRIESFSVDLMDMLQTGRRRPGFTFAPEAATDRLRDVINKPIPSDDLLRTAEEVYKRGWTSIKMYFMIGHPTQTIEDVQAIADLAKQVLAVGQGIIGGKAKVRVGVSTLVPKPHTPFQWVPMEDRTSSRSRSSYCSASCAGAVFPSRGTTRRKRWSRRSCRAGIGGLSDVIQRAWELGAKLEGWGEYFNFDAWLQAFDEFDLDMDWYARRERTLDEVLPWDHISAGLKKQFLMDEYRHAYQGAVVDDCREHCFSCGILGHFKEQRREAADEAWACPSLGRDKMRQPVDICSNPTLLQRRDVA